MSSSPQANIESGKKNRSPRKVRKLLLWVVTLGALTLLIWNINQRIVRVAEISELTGRAELVDVPSSESLTGYINNQREFIVPEQTEESFHLIAQTQQMLAQRTWRIRQVSYDNAPFGREENSSSLYHWWLAGLASLYHWCSGATLGISVERVAQFAEPLIYLILLATAVGLTTIVFGIRSAAALSVAMVATVPFAVSFLPGEPNNYSFVLSFALMGSLLILAGLKESHVDAAHPNTAPRRVSGWFISAGIVGGLSLWIDIPTGIIVTLSVFLGSLVRSVLLKQIPASAPAFTAASIPTWRIWGWSGGSTILVAYLVEFFPDHLGWWRWETIHPIYALGFILCGEFLQRTARLLQTKNESRRSLEMTGAGVVGAALFAVCWLIWKKGESGAFNQDPSVWRLTGLPMSPEAASVWQWVLHDGITATFSATLSPLMVLGFAIWQLMDRAVSPHFRALVGYTLGPILLTGVFAIERLKWWSLVDCGLLVLLVVLASEADRTRRFKYILPAVIILGFVVPGLPELVRRPDRAGHRILTPQEAELLIVRDLAHWLSKKSAAQDVIIYAPPKESTGLCFYGGFRGIGSSKFENLKGLRAAVTIAEGTSPEEILTLLQARDIRYIIIPAWDTFFEEYAREFRHHSADNEGGSFISALRQWELPPWLLPIAYATPKIPGFDEQTVLVFEVVPEQKPADAASRLADYLLEIGAHQNAVRVASTLHRFPGDIAALASLAGIENALGDSAQFDETFHSLVARITQGGDRYISWDRRVSLAVVLTRGKRTDLARDQIRKCVLEINETKLRSLSTSSLHNFLVLCHAYDCQITNDSLRATASNLLPAELKDHL